MTTSLEALIGRRGNHAVGYWNCVVNPRQIDGGAMCAVDMDNFEMVELFYANPEDEVPSIKPLAGTDVKGYFVYSSEVLHDGAIETKLDFFNGKGTMANVWVQEPGTTFKVSNFVCAAGEPQKGMYAQWVVGAGEACPKANGHFEITAEKPEGENVFMVWGYEEDTTYELLGLPTVMLYVMQ